MGRKFDENNGIYRVPPKRRMVDRRFNTQNFLRIMHGSDAIIKARELLGLISIEKIV